LPDFARSETTSSSQSTSLWELALQKKKQYVDERGSKIRANRADIIRRELADFNELQAQAEKRNKQVERLERLAENQSTRIRDVITEAVSTP